MVSPVCSINLTLERFTVLVLARHCLTMYALHTWLPWLILVTLETCWWNMVSPVCSINLSLKRFTVLVIARQYSPCKRSNTRDLKRLPYHPPWKSTVYTHYFLFVFKKWNILRNENTSLHCTTSSIHHLCSKVTEHMATLIVYYPIKTARIHITISALRVVYLCNSVVPCAYKFIISLVLLKISVDYKAGYGARVVQIKHSNRWFIYTYIFSIIYPFVNNEID